jgi:hypothetical protein
MEKVYVETTIPSYLTAKPTDNLIAGARQLITQRWWDTERSRYQLFVSGTKYRLPQICTPEELIS